MTSSTGWRIRVGALALAATALTGCPQRTETPAEPAATTPDEPPAAPVEREPWFEDVTARSGITFLHHSGHQVKFWYPEIIVGGVCLLDYDGDGFLDVYFVQAGSIDPGTPSDLENKLYRNRGDWTFEDVTAGAGVGDKSYGMGCTAGDYDSDGDVDLYVTNVRANVLYRNEGDGRFSDVTDLAGVGDDSWGSSAVFVDYDRDGLRDLFVVNYVHWTPETERECFSGSIPDYCSPKNYKASARDTLFRNLGDGRFEDVSVDMGLNAAYGNGLGVACADYNLDQRPDFYVTNDGSANQLWLSTEDGGLEEDATLSGCAFNRHGWAEAGMGVAAVDADDDGDPDLFMTHIEDETNTFYFNVDGGFDDATADVGLGRPSQGRTGFGMGFADFDHDGYLDIYVANGRVMLGKAPFTPDDPWAQPNQLYRGLPGAKYVEAEPPGGSEDPFVGTSRAAAFGDLDNDGDVDIVITNKDGRPQLLRNVAGSRGRWIQFRVLDDRGTDAIGARLRIAIEGRTVWRTVQRAYSYCAANDPRVHYGLGSTERVESVTVIWPDGHEETFGPFEADREYELRRG